MEHLINPYVKSIQISGIRTFFNRVAQVPDAVSLTIGQPDFPTPDHIKDAAKHAIDENHTTYTHNAGMKELREAVGQFLFQKYRLDYRPDEEIIVTVGASQAIFIALQTILQEGTEVILPGPVYPGYEPVIRLCGAKPVHIDTTGNGFKLSASLIERHLTSRTRCIVLPYPSNPTGCLLERDELAEIANLLQGRDVFVLSDEIYSELIYEGNHHSIAEFPGMKEKTIVINGLSKSHSMTGWRIGFACASSSVAKHMLKVMQYNVSCASSVSQHAALEALTAGADDAAGMRKEFKKRRDYVFERLVRMGLDVVKPKGAFYLFPSVKKFGLSSLAFAEALLEAQKVAVVPGDAFSEFGNGYVRISYAYSMDVLAEGLDRLEAFLTERA